jgi:ABC-type Co2+ transport system permease subunit
MLGGMLNISEIIKRLIKYIIEGLMVSIAAFAIPKRSMNLEEIASIALTAAATFAILDTFIPSFAPSARQGTGLGIGLNLSGFPL